MPILKTGSAHLFEFKKKSAGAALFFMYASIPSYPYTNELLTSSPIFKTINRLIMVENNNQRNQQDANQKSRRGFAAMDPEKQRQIASEGGRAAHKQGVAHEWSTEEARQAGRKGGQNSKGSRPRRDVDIRAME